MGTLALPEAIEQEKLVKMGAEVVRHGRYVTFQLAQLAVPRNLSREILRRIDELRRRPQAGDQAHPELPSQEPAFETQRSPVGTLYIGLFGYGDVIVPALHPDFLVASKDWEGLVMISPFEDLPQTMMRLASSPGGEPCQRVVYG